MLVSEAAYQRKNRVLANPASRLNSLSKTEFEEDTDEETMEPPTSFLNEMMLSSTKHKRKVGRHGEPKISPLDLKGTQRIALCNLLSYMVSMLLGSFVCHVVHGPTVDRYCPLVLRLIFTVLDAFGLGHIVRIAFAAWDRTPDPMRGTIVKVLTYGSLILNLYPMWSSMRKQNNPPNPPVDDDEEDFQCLSREDSIHSDDATSTGFLSDLDEEHLSMIGAFVLQASAACLVFGLLGYDGLYNAHFLSKFFA